MRRWAVAVLVGCLLAYAGARLWAAGQRSSAVGPTTEIDSAMAAFRSAAVEADRVATAVQRIRWARALPQADTLLVPEALPIPTATRAMVDRALGALPAPDRVAAAVVRQGWLRPEDGSRMPPRSREGIEYLLPEDGVCRVAIHVPGGASTPYVLGNLLQPDRVLGPCALVSRYGSPGDAVRAWLREGAGRFAVATSPSPRGPAAVPEGRRLTRLEQACAGRDDRACELLLAQPSHPAPSGYWYSPPAADDPLLAAHVNLAVVTPFAGAGYHLLADIEAAAGADAFREFWTTRDEDIGTALSGALDRPAGAWLGDWAAARFPELRAGGPGPVDAVLALLAIGLFVVLALFIGARGRPLGR